jgi:hypothetical protein
MSNFDPVDNNIFKKVYGIDNKYINHNKYLWNSINSYLRPQANFRKPSNFLVKISDLKNDFNERLVPASIEDAYNVHKKFLNEGNKVVDMSDYEKKYERSLKGTERSEPVEEKQKMSEIIKENIKDAKSVAKEEDKEELEGQDLKNFSLKMTKNRKKARRSTIGSGKVKKITVGNKKLPEFNFYGLDIGNEFKADMPKRRGRKVGGARTGNPKPQTEGTKQFNKQVVGEMKDYIKNNIFEKNEVARVKDSSNSMTGATVKPRKIGGGRAEYQKKLKEIREKHKCSLKEAMQIYKKNKK